MNRIVETALCGLLLFAVGELSAQSFPPASPGAPADYQKMIADHEAAAAAARQPGDENLSCEALRSEIERNMQDPALKEYAESAGALAQRDMDTMASAQAAFTGGQVPAGTPGPPGAEQSVPAATTPELAVEQRFKEQQQQVEKLTTLMPLLMRTQRLTELAVLQACDWLTEPGYAGLTAPVAE